MNNVAVALFLASTLQPVLAIVQQQRPLRFAESVASLMFFLAAVAFFATAQIVARRLED